MTNKTEKRTSENAKRNKIIFDIRFYFCIHNILYDNPHSVCNGPIMFSEKSCSFPFICYFGK